MPPSTIPAGHNSHEFKLEFGNGSVTGGITATIEMGKTGIPLGDSQIKALEATTSVQLNGLVGRMEASLLNGELDVELFEGLKIAIEANIMSGSLDTDGGGQVDPMSISLKLVGDIGHLLNAGPDVTITVDGRITVALGGKLAAKLASFTAAQLEQKLLAKELEEVGDAVGKHASQLKDLEAKADLLDAQGNKKAAAEAREQALKHADQIKAGTKQIDGLSGRLKSAKAKANNAISKLKGKVAGQVAKVMQNKAAAFVARKLVKLIPILNMVSTVLDVIELVGMLRHLLKFEFGDGGGGGDGEKSDEKHPDGGGPAGKADESKKDGSVTSGGGEPAPAEAKAAIERARNEVPPPARSILNALTRPGDGPQLDPDQIKMVGLLVPPDLSADELAEVLASLRGQKGKGKTAEEIIEAIDAAVRAVRNRGRTVKVNGEDRPDLANASAAEQTAPAQEGGGDGQGPITSPRQVAGLTSASEVVRNGEAAVIGRWFRTDGENLVLSSEGTAWIKANQKTDLDEKTQLLAVGFSVEKTQRGWSLTVTFTLEVNAARHLKTHSFLVREGGEDDGFGAKVGELKFEGYRTFESAP